MTAHDSVLTVLMTLYGSGPLQMSSSIYYITNSTDTKLQKALNLCFLSFLGVVGWCDGAG